MVTLTPKAAEAIKQSMAKGNVSPYLGLRLAAKPRADGSLEYGMGFDEINDDDMLFRSEGVEVVVRPEYFPLLDGLTLDFDKLDNGEEGFLFLNPNDPAYQPPGPVTGAVGEDSGGCGSGGCG